MIDVATVGVRAVVILSGGLDSTTCMAVADEKREEIYAITFAYEQRHLREIEAAKKVAHYYRSVHHIIDLGKVFGASALTSSHLKPETEQQRGTIPLTYVPARNILFLSYALSFAEKVEASKIYIGVNALDNPGYPDCRPEFIAAFQHMIQVGTKLGTEGRGVQIEAPLINWTKAQIIAKAVELEAPLHLTHTCYNGTSPACGICDSCRLRREGFEELGLTDPIPYRR
ncbi:7-cyano-7-deazaguanine synthase QueC [Heliobacterium chlorum]|uniref:7-cyano-7-deazaguanine synthase n=1 Tax=Heliobacterium chlorum TaxID=2698 RepID=A0ABR7SWW4_HELCL|nr:7-cyano-7-deazaguanine synthase QueC [Heliobacterium chlorum]MBC9783048.1 7-cyano-7-deazaguanine synthase QueC [Heliobacterium chlorum]